MTDVYLRPGAANPPDPILRDPTAPDPAPPVGGTVRRYYRGRPRRADAVMLSRDFYYVDEAA